MSNIRVDNAGPSAGGTLTGLIDGLAKAWITADQGGSTIDKSFNVTSLTDDGTGQSTIAITNDMADANYAVHTAIQDNNNTTVTVINVRDSTAPAVGSFGVYTLVQGTGVSDVLTTMYASIFGDLA